MMTRPPASVHRQALRFVVAGLAVTALSAFIYALSVMQIGLAPLAGNLIAYLGSVLVGYRLHAHWTFEQHHWQVDDAQTNLRFLAGSISSLVLNTFWVWLLTVWYRGPSWLPIVPMIVATPIASFLFNRHWTFKARDHR